jgi:hypothetical protein
MLEDRHKMAKMESRWSLFWDILHAKCRGFDGMAWAFVEKNSQDSEDRHDQTFKTRLATLSLIWGRRNQEAYPIPPTA